MATCGRNSNFYSDINGGVSGHLITVSGPARIAFKGNQHFEHLIPGALQGFERLERAPTFLNQPRCESIQWRETIFHHKVLSLPGSVGVLIVILL